MEKGKAEGRESRFVMGTYKIMLVPFPRTRFAVFCIVLSMFALMLGDGEMDLAAAVEQSILQQIARRPVSEILQDAPVPLIDINGYWRVVRDRPGPMVVFFYSNEDAESQRVATLVKYVALDYEGRIDFRRVEVAAKGKPSRELAKDLEKRFSLDATPGILFYDNVGKKMVLEKEDYVEADFKEFRTPAMLLWNVYYAAVRKELDKLLAD